MKRKKGLKGKLDKVFSLYIRTRDNFTCQRCKTKHKTNSMGYHCSHIEGRGKESVRWDERNAYGLCYGCHSLIDQHFLEKIEFATKMLGTKKYKTLCRRAEKTSDFKDYDIQEMIDKYQKKLDKLVTFKNDNINRITVMRLDPTKL